MNGGKIPGGVFGRGECSARPSQDEGESLRTLLEALVRLERERAVRYARNRVANLDTAQDLVQQVSLAVFRSGRTFRSLSEIRCYFYEALRNLCRDHGRGLARTPALVFLDQGSLDSFPADEASAPDGRLVRREKLTAEILVLEALLPEVAELPEEERELLHAHYWEGLSYRALSETTGLSVWALKRKVARIQRDFFKNIRTNSPDDRY